jgi:hypothetical protein
MDSIPVTLSKNLQISGTKIRAFWGLKVFFSHPLKRYNRAIVVENVKKFRYGNTGKCMYLNSLSNQIKTYKALKEMYFKGHQNNKPSVGLNQKIIMPIFYWGNTNVSWLQIFFALNYLRNGAQVFFIYDDDFTSRHRFTLNFVLIRKLISVLKKHPNAEIIRPIITNTQSTQYDDLIYKKHYFNAQWTQKKSIAVNKFSISQSLLEEDRKVAGAIDTVLKSARFDMCFCPGGVYGNSYLWRYLSDQNFIRFSSFDAGAATLIITPAGVAAHRTDVIHRFNANSEKIRVDPIKIKREVNANIFKRSQSTIEKIEDLHSRVTLKNVEDEPVQSFFDKYQKNICIENALQNVVIFLNTSWDSAALDLEPWKISQIDWLDLLVPELARNGAKKIIIRQHPDEQFYPSADDYVKKIGLYNQSQPTTDIKLIDKSSTISSYNLLQNSTSVFTFSSTIGLEANILNRPTFVFKQNYQTILNSLPRYTPGDLTKNLNLFFTNVEAYKTQSMLAYYFSQLEGWEKVSIPKFSRTLEDTNAVNRLNEIAWKILTVKEFS